MRYAHNLILSALSAALAKTKKNIITSFPLLPKACYNTINMSAIIVK